MNKLSEISSREDWVHLYESAMKEFRSPRDRRWSNYDSRFIAILEWLIPEIGQVLPDIEAGRPINSKRIGGIISDLWDVNIALFMDPVPFQCCALLCLCAFVVLIRSNPDYGPPSHMRIQYLKRLVAIARVHDDVVNLQTVVAVLRADTRLDQWSKGTPKMPPGFYPDSTDG